MMTLYAPHAAEWRPVEFGYALGHCPRAESFHCV